MIEWRPFLTRWSRELTKTELVERLDPPAESSEWLGFAPARQVDIEDLERRLGVLLPPSYKSFLLTSNGWRRTTTFIGRIRPTSEVNWFRIENEQWAEVYSECGSDLPDEELYDYEEYSELHHRAEHMTSLLQISDVDDGVYLLNPEAVTPDGEWEAWFFANWVPGAHRFPSFAHLMLHEYQSFAESEGVKASTDALPKLMTPAPNVPRVPAERIRKTQAKALSLETLIEQMKSSEEKTRAKVVRSFFGKLKGRSRAKQRLDLVQPLTDLFYAASDADVRTACIAALTELADETAPPAPLFDALSDVEPGVVLQGIFALHYFPDARAVDPLCKFIDSRRNVLFNENAMSQLGEMGDEQAVPTLVNVLLDTKNEFDQSFGSAGIALGRCGEKGFNALVTAVNHPDPRVRHAVVCGLDISGDSRAAVYLDRMEKDADPKVRERAKIRMGKPDW